MSDTSLFARVQQLSDSQREALARKLHTLAFQVEDGEKPQQLTAYVVKKGADSGEISELQAHLKARLPAYMVPTSFVMLDAFPLMPNGKVDRRQLPLPVPRTEKRSAVVEEMTAIERQLAEIWSSVLGTEIGIHDDFFEMGGDSLLSIQIVARARREGLVLKPSDLFDYPTVAQLAQLGQEAEDRQGQASQLILGDVALTPIQNWFFGQNTTKPAHWNQAVWLTAQSGIKVEALQTAVRALLTYHDALRARFWRDDSCGSWRQAFLPLPAELPITHHHLLTPSNSAASEIEAIVTDAHADLSLEMGDLFRVIHIATADQIDSIVLLAHHLLVDAVSWRILLADFQTYYGAAVQNKQIEQPPPTTSLQTWSQRLVAYADSPAILATAEYWLDPRFKQAMAIPADFPESSSSNQNTVESARTISSELGQVGTQAILQTVCTAYHVDMDEVLLAALALTLGRWLARDSLLIALEGHGREPLFADLDVSQTVGWFTTVYPVQLSTATDIDLGQNLLGIKEQLRAIPHNGLSYDLLRYLNEERDMAQTLKRFPEPQFLFNYLGRVDGALPAVGELRVASELVGVARHPADARFYRIEVNAYIKENNLCTVWSYSDNLHQAKTIEQLATQFVETLRDMIEHSTLPEAGGYSPSDFSLAALDQDDLFQISDLLEGLDD